MKNFVILTIAFAALCAGLPAEARYTKIEPCRPGENSVTKINELVVRRCVAQTPEQVAKDVELLTKILGPNGKTDSELKPLTTPAPDYDVYRRKYKENLKGNDRQSDK